MSASQAALVKTYAFTVLAFGSASAAATTAVQSVSATNMTIPVLTMVSALLIGVRGTFVLTTRYKDLEKISESIEARVNNLQDTVNEVKKLNASQEIEIREFRTSLALHDHRIAEMERRAAAP